MGPVIPLPFLLKPSFALAAASLYMAARAALLMLAASAALVLLFLAALASVQGGEPAKNNGQGASSYVK